MEEIEEFRDIPGYEGLYQVSQMGNVLSLNYRNTKKANLLSPDIDRDGYRKVSLTKNKTPKHFRICRLVGLVWLEIPKNIHKNQINHLSGVRNDDRLINLEWVTASENGLHAFRELGRKPVKSGLGKFKELNPNSKRIMEMDNEGNDVKIWNSIIEAAEKLNIGKTNISAVCRGKRLYTNGKRFRFLKDGE